MGISFQYVDYDFSVPKALQSDDNWDFGVKLPIQRGWRDSDRRMLVVLESVDTEDIKNGYLLSSVQGTLFPNLLELAQSYSGASASSLPKFAFVNFDYFRCRHLSIKDLDSAHKAATIRVRKLIAKFKPTDVFVIGATASSYLEEMTLEEIFFQYGRPVNREGIWWSRGPDLSRAYQKKKIDLDDDEAEESQKIANLAGFLSRCLGNALVRRPVYKIDFKPNPILITNDQQWKRVYERLMETDNFAFDSEATSLSRKHPCPLFMQFGFDGSKSYILPLLHKDSPFKNRIDNVRKDLRRVFAKKFDPMRDYDPKQFILGQHLKFDYTLTREWLNIQVLEWPILDLMALQYTLDENLIGLFLRVGKKRKSAFSLEWMTRWHGCDFYSDNAFGKNDRMNIGDMPIDTPGMLEYMAADTQIPYLIMDQQFLLAKRAIVNGKPYLPAYIKLNLLQMSNIINIQSMMEHRGDHLDVKWLEQLRFTGGPLDKARIELQEKFRGFASVKRLNDQLVKESGIPARDMFGGGNWLFSVTKPAHKARLFFEELALEPLAVGKSGAGKIDKAFFEHYGERDDLPEVLVFKDLSQVGKVRSTYVEGFLRKVRNDPDMDDHNLRPNFGFLDTVTGRPNSSNPNLQNIIQRGPLAKLIKRAFISLPNGLIIKLDYSAHEVRMWAIESGDTLLCMLFVIGRWLRQQYRKTGHPGYKKLMDTIGDIHKRNCKFFFEVDEDKVTKDQRNDIKSVVFGGIYGRGASSIARQVNKAAKIIQSLMDRFFKRFVKGAKYLENQKIFAVTKGYTVSAINRMRNLFSHLFGIDGLTAGAERRGANAPIQGISSDIGQTAAYLYEVHMDRFVRKFDLYRGRHDTGVTSFVHDAIKTAADMELVLASIQILQWCCTIGVCEYFTKHFGMRFYVEPEIEFEIGASDDTLEKWDWHDDSLREIIKKSLLKHKEIHGSDPKTMFKRIYSIRNTEMQDYLDEHYPILSDWKDAQHLDTKSDTFRKEVLPALKKEGIA